MKVVGSIIGNDINLGYLCEGKLTVVIGHSKDENLSLIETIFERKVTPHVFILSDFELQRDELKKLEPKNEDLILIQNVAGLSMFDESISKHLRIVSRKCTGIIVSLVVPDHITPELICFADNIFTKKTFMDITMCPALIQGTCYVEYNDQFTKIYNSIEGQEHEFLWFNDCVGIFASVSTKE